MGTVKNGWAIALLLLLPLDLDGQRQAEKGPAKRELSITWSVKIIPGVCENGEVLPNVQVPVVGGAKITCLNRGLPSHLPPLSEPNAAAETMTEGGTVVAVGFSRYQIAIAADSRTAKVASRNGQRVFTGVSDERCKLVELGPDMLFAAAGQTKTAPGQTSVDESGGRVYYDAQELAKEGYQNLRFDPAWMEPNQMVLARAEKWAADMAFRLYRGSSAGIYLPPAETWLVGVFAGREASGALSLVIVNLRYERPRPGLIVYPVSFTIEVPEIPADFTWIEPFGHREVINGHTITKMVSDDTRATFSRIRAAQLRPRSDFAPVLRELMGLALNDEPHAYPDGSKQVGGAIDIASIGQTGEVKWVNRKAACKAVSR